MQQEIDYHREYRYRINIEPMVQWKIFRNRLKADRVEKQLESVGRNGCENHAENGNRKPYPVLLYHVFYVADVENQSWQGVGESDADFSRQENSPDSVARRYAGKRTLSDDGEKNVFKKNDIENGGKQTERGNHDVWKFFPEKRVHKDKNFRRSEKPYGDGRNHDLSLGSKTFLNGQKKDIGNILFSQFVSEKERHHDYGG